MSSPLGDVPPPPGTLGQTYARPSRPIPVEKHPRVGMIDVRIVGAARVAVRGTNNFRTEDKLDGFRDINDPNLWHFESKPLLPGLPHIYRVEATIGEPGAERLEVRYVRLIMGRIVDLTY